MFTKRVVVIFLLLGLASSIAHAIPHQNRVRDPCNDDNNNNNNHKTGKDGTNTNTGDTTNGKHTHPKLTGTGTGTTATGTNPKDQAKGKNNAVTGTGTNNTGGDNGDQTSLTLDQSLINLASKSDGLNNATNGTAASLTSSNNFINFCANKVLTNGQQIKTGSCNPIPMGDIPSTDKMPSCKFVNPPNFSTLKSNTTFTLALAVKNMIMGNFVNPDKNYYAAPQQLDQTGGIIGHTHFVVEQLDSITSTQPTDPTTFAFFKGIDDKVDENNQVSTPVTGGLSPGTYRISTITTTANHAAVNGAVAQRGSFEDTITVTVTEDGNPKNSGTGADSNGTGNIGTGKTGTGNTGTGNTGTGNTGTGNTGTGKTGTGNTGTGNTGTGNTGTGNTGTGKTGTGNTGTGNTGTGNTGTGNTGTGNTGTGNTGTGNTGTGNTGTGKTGTGKTGTGTTANGKDGTDGTSGTTSTNTAVEKADTTKTFGLHYGNN